MNKFTPGPWTVNETDYKESIGIECKVNGIEHTVVMYQFCYPNFQKHGSEEKRSNAALIAAAPELYNALKDLVGYHDFPDGGASYEDLVAELIPLLNNARAALTKATTI